MNIPDSLFSGNNFFTIKLQDILHHAMRCRMGWPHIEDHFLSVNILQFLCNSRNLFRDSSRWLFEFD